VTKWLAAVKDYAAIANGGPAFPAMPTNDQMAAAYGPGWMAAGSAEPPISKGEYYSGLLNNEYLTQAQPGVHGPGIGLRLSSRESVRPDEMQSAYNAVNPETGEPLLLPQIGGYLESTYGLSPTGSATPPGGTDQTGQPGAAGPLNAPGGTFYDPNSGALVMMPGNPDPSSGLLEVPNNFDPNDPNAGKIKQAMGVIAQMNTQGSIYSNQTLWHYLDDVLTPLGIDPATFVVGVLNYNNYQINDDGTISAHSGAFPGSTPAGGTGPPTAGGGGTTPAGGGMAGGPLGGGTGGGGGQTPAGGNAAGNPINSQQVQPDTSTAGGPVERAKGELFTNPPGLDQVNLGQFDPGSMTPTTGGQQAAQLAKQHGNRSTIDPRYPDWMLLYQPQQQGKLNF
jgi:hypothetical protein